MSDGARRGRPPNSDSAATRDRLLDAAAASCSERGFDGATLQAITARAGLTASAVYNHFDSREELLYAAGVRELRRMTDAVRRSERTSFEDVAKAYLDPDMASTRRLLAELHLASRRDPRLAELLESWHRSEAEVLARHQQEDPEPLATAKALFLLLLGLCHVDDLGGVPARHGALVDRVLIMARSLREIS